MPGSVEDRVVVTVRAYGRGRASGVELDTRFRQVWSFSKGVATRLEEHPA